MDDTKKACPDCRMCPTRDESLFRGASPAVLECLEACKHVRRLEKGEVLFREGESCPYLFCINKGWIKLFRTTRAGELQILGCAGPGDPLGHRAFFSDKPHGATAEALIRSEICCLDRKTLLWLAREEPPLLLSWVERLSIELDHVEGQLVDVIHRTVRQRVAALLLELSKKHAGGRVETPFSRIELAQWVGTTPETIARTLSEFHRVRAIRKTRHAIQVLNREKLQRLAEFPNDEPL